jgi:hypothetical protein
MLWFEETGTKKISMEFMECSKSKAILVTGLRCQGFHIFQTIGSQMAVTPALRACRTLTLRTIL